jgi:hypothetical protein
VPELPPGVAYVDLATGPGALHSLARRSDGSVVAWGLNEYGQCNVPSLPAGVTCVEVSTGWGHSVARLSDGSIESWGDDSIGLLDDPPAPAGWACTAVDAGARTSAALLAAGPPCGAVASYCTPPKANSAGASGAHLEVAQGCAGLTTNDLAFQISGLPPGEVGILLYSSGQQHSPFGNGWVCAAGSVQRVTPPLVALPDGTLSYALDLTQFPFSGSANAILPGSSWSFQYWYRDASAAPFPFNLSDGVHIVFSP